MKPNISLLPTLLLLAPAAWAKQVQRPNIIFIMCDDMGYATWVVMDNLLSTHPTSTSWHKRACALHKPMLGRLLAHHQGRV